MEFHDVVRQRRMVRRFRPDAVPDEVIDRLLDVARRGPSAGFSQGQAFLVVQGADLPRFWSVAGAAAGEGTRRAPLVVVPLSSKRVYLDRYAEPDKGWTERDETQWPVPFWHIDTGMAAMLLLLAVVDAGLGALYFGIVPAEVPPFREAFGVPADHDPIGAIAIGSSDEERQSGSPRTRPRRPWTETVHRGRWNS